MYTMPLFSKRLAYVVNPESNVVSPTVNGPWGSFTYLLLYFSCESGSLFKYLSNVVSSIMSLDAPVTTN